MYVTEQLGLARQNEMFARAERERLVSLAVRGGRPQALREHRSALAEVVHLGRSSLAAVRRTFAV